MAGANRQGPSAGPRDWPRVGKQPANHENHAVTLLEDIEAITSIVQTIYESEKQGVPLNTCFFCVNGWAMDKPLGRYYSFLSKHSALEARKGYRFLPQRVPLYKHIDSLPHRPIGFSPGMNNNNNNTFIYKSFTYLI